LARLLPGEVHLLHYHKRETEIYYVIQGRAKMRIDVEEIDAASGTAIYGTRN
jgi:mannose-6-phosphate isomerase-like protein (cupin superfamily)